MKREELKEMVERELRQVIRETPEDEMERDRILEETKSRLYSKLFTGTGKSGISLDSDLSRRDFLKVLGLGMGGLALSSQTAALWALWQPASKGTSDIDCDTVDSKHASEVSGGVNSPQNLDSVQKLYLTGGSPNYIQAKYTSGGSTYYTLTTLTG